MKYKKIKDGELIEIGDLVVCETGFSKKSYKVHRVTAKYCYVKYNDVAEGKFKKLYSSFSFTSLPRQSYSMNTHTAYTPVIPPGGQKRP